MRANYIDIVKGTIKAHPEIDCSDENQRGAIVVYVAQHLNPQDTNEPWGRKSRNASGTDLNTDGLTEILDNNTFYIYDILNGAPFDLTENISREDHYATWVEYGPFSQGENGFWYPAYEVNEDTGNDDTHIEQTVEELKQSLAEIKDELDELKRTCVRYGDFIGLQTGKGFYLCAEDQGLSEDKVMTSVRYAGNVNATRNGLGPWEKLKVIKS